jgi:aldose 1-epimerase
MERKPWGSYQGKPVELFTLPLGEGYRAEITNFGGALVSLYAPDQQGNVADVLLGYDNLEGYLQCTSHLGVLVGRHANRIEGAQFTLGDVTYKLAANDGRNHLHGGPGGFGKVVWDPEVVETPFGQGLKLRYLSPHGEEGYPGNLQVEVTYRPTQKAGGLGIDYVAETDQDTVVNLTNHAYFNLAGRGQGSIIHHELELCADFFTAINSEGIPTGEIFKVDGTPLDFRQKRAIAEGIDADDEQIRAGRGYDHNWIINGGGRGLVKAARVEHPSTGRVLEVWTTKPGIQFYSGNFLGSGQYPYRTGFCLETQYFPNSLKFAHFPSAILKKGQRYEHSTIYDFSVVVK